MCIFRDASIWQTYKGESRHVLSTDDAWIARDGWGKDTWHHYVTYKYKVSHWEGKLVDAFNDHFYRTMVTSKDVGMDGSRLEMFLQSVGYKEIVNTPPRVLLSGTEAVGPP